MSHSPILLLCEDDGCRLVKTGGETVSALPPINAPQELIRELISHGCADAPLIIGIPATWCMAAGISTTGLRKQAKRQAMLYRLEEKLPVEAESLVVDFSCPDQERALGVAMLPDRLEVMLQELESAALSVECICPTTFIAAEGFEPAEEAALLLIGDNGHLEILATRNRKPAMWRIVPKTSGIATAPTALRMCGGSPVVLLRWPCARL